MCLQVETQHETKDETKTTSKLEPQDDPKEDESKAIETPTEVRELDNKLHQAKIEKESTQKFTKEKFE